MRVLCWRVIPSVLKIAHDVSAITRLHLHGLIRVVCVLPASALPACSVCAFASVHARASVGGCACVYDYKSAHARESSCCLRLRMHVCMRAFVCACVCVHAHICLCMCVQACVRTRKYERARLCSFLCGLVSIKDFISSAGQRITGLLKVRLLIHPLRYLLSKASPSTADDKPF